MILYSFLTFVKYCIEDRCAGLHIFFRFVFCLWLKDSFLYGAVRWIAFTISFYSLVSWVPEFVFYRQQVLVVQTLIQLRGKIRSVKESRGFLLRLKLNLETTNIAWIGILGRWNIFNLDWDWILYFILLNRWGSKSGNSVKLWKRRPVLHHYDGPKFRLELSVPEVWYIISLIFMSSSSLILLFL